MKLAGHELVSKSIPSCGEAPCLSGAGGSLGLDLSALDTLRGGGFNGNIMISVQIYLGRVLRINGSEDERMSEPLSRKET